MLQKTQTNGKKKVVLESKAPVVLATRDYDQFKRILGNRSVNINHVNDLVKKISVKNLLYAFPGVVTADNYLIDGQHRLEAAKVNKLDYFYIQLEGTVGDLLVAIINSSQRAWMPEDYVRFYADRGNEQYIFMLDILKEHKISIGNQRALFGKNKGTKMLKEGQLVFYTTEEEKKWLLEMVEAYLSLRGVFIPEVFRDREFLGALRIMFQQVSAPEIIETVEKANIQITGQHDIKDYLRLFEALFNRHRREKNQLRFF